MIFEQFSTSGTVRDARVGRDDRTDCAGAVIERRVHATLCGTKVKVMWMHTIELEMQIGVLFMQVYL